MIFSNPVANFYMVKSLNGSFLFLTLLHINSRQLFIFVTIRVPTVYLNMKTWAFIYPLFNIAAKHFDGILQKNTMKSHKEPEDYAWLNNE